MLPIGDNCPHSLRRLQPVVAMMAVEKTRFCTDRDLRVLQRDLNDEHAVIECAELLPVWDVTDEFAPEEIGRIMRRVALADLLRNEIVTEHPIMGEALSKNLVEQRIARDDDVCI